MSQTLGYPNWNVLVGKNLASPPIKFKIPATAHGAYSLRRAELLLIKPNYNQIATLLPILLDSRTPHLKGSLLASTHEVAMKVGQFFHSSFPVGVSSTFNLQFNDVVRRKIPCELSASMVYDKCTDDAPSSACDCVCKVVFCGNFLTHCSGYALEGLVC